MPNNQLAQLLGVTEDTTPRNFWTMGRNEDSDTMDLEGVGSSFSKLRQLLKSETEGLKLQQYADQRKLEVDHDSALSQVLDTARVGIMKPDEAAQVGTSLQRQLQFARDQQALEHTKQLQEQNAKLSSIERFFALTPAEIEAKTPKSGGLRSDIVFDPTTNTYRQQAKAVQDENVIRPQEIAENFDVPVEAVYAKREQQQVLEGKLQRQTLSDARTVLGIKNEQQRTQQMQANRAKQLAFERSPLGLVQNVIKETRNVPTATLNELLQNDAVDQLTKSKAQAAIQMRSQLEDVRDAKKLEQLQLRQVQTVIKKVKTDFGLSPALVQRYAPEVLGKDGKLDVNALQKYASTQARELARIMQSEARNVKALDLEHEYGAGGLYDNALNDNEQGNEYGSLGYTAE